MDHQQIIDDYEKGRVRLKAKIKSLLQAIGTDESAKRMGVSKAYISQIKTDGKKVSYQQLLNIYRKIT